MERIRLLYEQLEEARRLMLQGTLLDTRLALILLDNAIELLMYRELRSQFAWDDNFAPPPQELRIAGIEYPPGPPYGVEERRRAEQEFRPKVKLLTHQFNKISSKQASILTICHDMRNEAFHREAMNPDILQPTTELLFLTVAELVRDFPIHSYSIPYGTTGENADFLRRFGLDKHGRFENAEVKAKMYGKLVEGVSFSWTLASRLSEDMVTRLDGIISGLSYVNADETDDAKLDHALRYSQFWRDIGAEVARGANEAGRIWKDDLDRAYEAWSKSPGPRYTIEKIRRKRIHASAIAKMSHPADALVRYAAIEKWMAPLEEDVSHAVFKYDEHINSLV